MLDSIEKAVDSFGKLRTFLHHKRGFVVLAFILFVVMIPLYLPGVNLNGNTLMEMFSRPFYVRNVAILNLIAELALLTFWLVIRKMPHFPQERIGLLIAVKTNDERLKVRLRDDFVQTIKRELAPVTSKISVESLSEYHCERLYAKNDGQLLQKYHYRTRAKLIVYGYADCRFHGGQESYHLKLDESVAHRPIPQHESRILAMEMLNSFPRETLIPTNNEFFGFRLTSALFGIAAKYIIGIICLYSQEFSLALQFHKSLLDLSLGQFKDFPQVQTLVEKAKKLVGDEAIILARIEALQDDKFAAMKAHLDLAGSLQGSVAYLILMGMYEFLANRDIGAAKHWTREAKKASKDDNVWAYNMAFLFAYEGNLGDAYRFYRTAFEKPANPTTHIECGLFIRRILKSEPDKIQLWYCLGLLYRFPHDDETLAVESFSEFRRLAIERDAFTEQVRYVESYLSKVKTRGAEKTRAK